MRRPLAMCCLLFVVSVFLAVSHMPPQPAAYEQAEGKNVYLAGIVYQKENRPSLSGEDAIILYLDHIAVSGESDSLFETDKSIQGVMCCLEESVQVPLGSTVAVRGKVQQFKQATNPGEFDSREYYQILKLDFRLKDAKIVKISKEYNKLQELLYQTKEKCSAILEQFYNRTDAGIMKTILLGDKNELSEEVEEQYKRNGIIHVMTISGLHISLLGMGLYRLLRKMGMPVWAAGISAVCFIGCYGLMTGMKASACRAVIMFAIKITADMIGRTYDMLTALSVAAVLILIEQPLYVRHAGFLLSFGAVLGIGVVLPVLQERAEALRKTVESRDVAENFVGKSIRRNILKGVLPGISIFLVSFPIQIFYYYQYPVYSILLNLFVVPLMTLVMISGLAVLAAGALPVSVVGTIGGKGMAVLGHLILAAYSFVCSGAEKLPGAVLVTGKPEGGRIVLYYGLLLLYLVLPLRRGTESDNRQEGSLLCVGIKGRKGGGIGSRDMAAAERIAGRERYVVAESTADRGRHVAVRILRLVILLIGFLVLLVRLPQGLEMTFLDVGQGDCIYVRSENGHSYLFDGGSTDKSKVGKYQITPFLKSKGIGKLEAVFVSHGDKDHYSGIEELLENEETDRIRIKCLVLPVTAKEEAEENRTGNEKGIDDESRYQIETGGDKETGKLKEKRAEGCERLAQLARMQKIEVVYIQAGDKITDGILSLECLNPVVVEDTVQGQDTGNEQSQVFYLTYRSFSALLTGDITGKPEKEMAKRLESLRADRPLTVLKVAHHGSGYSTDADFLADTKPVFSVISSGEDNSYGHPHEELLERLEETGTKVLRTDQMGAIEIKVKESVKVVGYMK